MDMPLSGFMDDYATWRRLPFPSLRRGKVLVCNGENLALIHGDLAEADYHLTQVISFVEQGVFEPSRTDVLSSLSEVIAGLARLSECTPAEERSVLDAHHQYAILLQRIYREYLRMGAENSDT